MRVEALCGDGSVQVKNGEQDRNDDQCGKLQTRQNKPAPDGFACLDSIGPSPAV
jgi:hypothetical protein